MPASQAILAAGTLLTFKRGAGTAIPVAEVRNISPPAVEADEVEVTTHAAAGWKQYIQGLKDPGEGTFDINWVPQDPSHDFTPGTGGLLALLQSGEVVEWVITTPGDEGITWTFDGFVKGFAPSMDPADALQATVTIRSAAEPTFANVVP